MSLTLPKQPGASLRVVDHPIARRPLASLGRRLHRTEFPDPQDLFLGWVMCLGKRTEYRVFQTIHAAPRSRGSSGIPSIGSTTSSAAAPGPWILGPPGLPWPIVLALNPTGRLYLVVDDTLLHKRGKKVYGLGWFRDAVASTAKRVATASGNNWVVMGLAIPIPLSPEQILCLPLSARLHLPGKGPIRAAWTWRRRCSPTSSGGSPIDRSS